MDEEIKKNGEMATIEDEEDIAINEDYTTLEAETIIIDDDSNIQTDAEYEQAVGQKELADEAREALSAVLLSVLEKGEINDDDIAEIAAQQEIYTENVTALKILGLTTEDEKSTGGKSTTNVITSNIDYDELMKVLSEKADWLYVDEDGQVMLNGEVVPKIKVVELEAEKIKADVGEFKDLTTENFTATNATIENLKANKADIEYLNANYATIQNLNATNANITNLQATKANIIDLNAANANIANLQAIKANITDLNAAKADINVLHSDVADITTLVNGNLTSDNIQSMVITGDKFTVANGFIKNAMIDSVSANKINAGVINTNNVSIQSNDGSMLLQGNLQQFKDKNGKVRIQIGKDAKGNFTFCLYDENGTGQLINEKGIQSSNAIADGLIVDAKVADNANISGGKIDMSSLFTTMNNSGYTLKSSKIKFDDKNQTLDVAFNNMTTTVKGNTDTLNTHTTSINTMDGKVTQLISDTTITKQDGTTTSLKDAYNATVDTVDSHSTKIGSLETNLATANNNISSVSSKQATLEQNLNGFKQTVSATYTTKADFNNLTIGGTNLYPNSNFKTKPQYFEQTGGSKVIWDSGVDGGSATTKYNGKVVQLYDNSGTSANPKDVYLTFAQTVTLQPNTTYTLSFDYYSAGAFVANSSYIYLWKTKGVTSTRQVIGLGVTNNNKNKTRLIRTFTTDSEHLIFQFRIGFVDTGTCWVVVDGVKLEKGNRATEWSPAPEDIDTSIATVDGKFTNYSTTSQMNSAINQKANEITSTVSETYATKASLTTVDNKFADYSTTSAMNSAINQKANEITSTVSETYATKTSLKATDDKFANYSTTSAMNSAINQKSDAILSTVSNTYTTKSDFGGLTVGGTNLLLKTKTSDNLIVGMNKTGDTYRGLTVRGGSIVNGNQEIWLYNFGTNFNYGDTFTFSFYAKGNITNLYAYFHGANTDYVRVAKAVNSQGRSSNGSDGRSLFKITNEWQRYWVTWTLVDKGYDKNVNKWMLLRPDGSTAGQKVYVCGCKMEKGNRATEWSPAPEDIDASITTVDNKFANYSTTSQMNSAINQKANEITSTVSETYATKIEFNNLNVGGRNLLVGCGSYTKDRPLTITSSAKDGHKEYNDIYTSINLEAGEYMIQAKTDGSWSSSHNIAGINPQDKKCALWLFRKNVNGTNTGHIFVNMINNPTKINITVSDKYYLRLNTYSDGSTAMTVKFWDIKLEKGNKATGWSPAPEDISGSITAVDNKFANYSTISAMNSAIKQKADSILSTVSSTYATTQSTSTLLKENITEYYLSTSNTTLSGGAWGTTSYTPTPGKYIWQRTKSVTNAGDIKYSNPICVSDEMYTVILKNEVLLLKCNSNGEVI